MYQKYLKRILDIILSIILLVILMPIMIIIFILVLMFIGYPIFTQIRPGLNNKLFTLYKFKTLYDRDGDELSRTSSLGNFLRAYGLDELPQLINILKNDMSLIGPRPLLKEYISKYSKKQLNRHSVKPGILGLAQLYEVNAPKKINSKIRLDLFYIEKLNFFLDVMIFCKIMKIIFLKKKKKKNNFKKLM